MPRESVFTVRAPGPACDGAFELSVLATTFAQALFIDCNTRDTRHDRHNHTHRAQ